MTDQIRICLILILIFNFGQLDTHYLSSVIEHPLALLGILNTQILICDFVAPHSAAAQANRNDFMITNISSNTNTNNLI